MKFSILAAALASVATAVPLSSTPEHGILAVRAGICWTNSITATTTSTSPLVADCEALAETNLPAAWTPTVENNYTFDVQNGTCGFTGVFNPSGGSMAASDVSITPSLVSNALNHAITYMADDGRVSATGAFACMLAGYQVKTGWTNFQIYTVV